MNLSDNWESADRQPLICPFLGLHDDPATAQYFPSQQNRCYHAKSPTMVRLAHQRAFCLAMNYTKCEEYLSDPNGSTPHRKAARRTWVPERKPIKPAYWIASIGIVVVALIIWQGIAHGLFRFGNPGSAPSSMVPVIPTLVESPTPVPTATPTPTLMATDTPFVPMATFAPTQILYHGLETPIGAQQNIIIHKVTPGESLESIASHFWTTTEAIQAINFQLQIPLLVDKLIVVPNNQTDVQGWPAFEAYNIPADIPVETLAQQLAVDPAMLKLYNGFSEGEIVHTGDWVLIPHPAKATP